MTQHLKVVQLTRKVNKRRLLGVGLSKGVQDKQCCKIGDAQAVRRLSHMLSTHCEVLSCSPELRWRVKPESVCSGFNIFGAWVLSLIMNSKCRPSHIAADAGRFAKCICEASLREQATA